MNPDFRKCMMAILRNPGWICFIWLGMVIGTSLIATPVRFSAEFAARADILDVSRVVFSALNKAEFLALITMLLIMRASHSAKQLWMPVFALALILIAQGTWLIPELSLRTDLIIAGYEPESSIVHGVYSTLELVKVLLLVFTGFRSLQLLVSR